MTHRYNRPDYRFYVVDSAAGVIDSGWEFREDAMERAVELREEGGKPKVMTKPRVGSTVLDPGDNSNWERRRKNPRQPEDFSHLPKMSDRRLRTRLQWIAAELQEFEDTGYSKHFDGAYDSVSGLLSSYDLPARVRAGLKRAGAELYEYNETRVPAHISHARAAIDRVLRDWGKRKNPVSYDEYWKRRRELFEISPPELGGEISDLVDRLALDRDGKAGRLARMYRGNIKKTAKLISKGQPISWQKLAEMAGDLGYLRNYTDDKELSELVKELDEITEIEDDRW